ncbi:SAM-dependent methyltransferase [Chloroflexota bacterium]
MDSNKEEIKHASKTQQKFTSLVEWGPTPPAVVKKMLELAQVGPEDIVYDLGCGDARIPIMAVKEFGVQKAVGYEIKQDLYEYSMKEIKKQKLQNRITLIRDDLLNADLSEASVITLFLSITANEHLRPKLEREAKSSTRIVSYYHPMKLWMANSTEFRPANRIYLYVVPRAFRIMPD